MRNSLVKSKPKQFYLDTQEYIDPPLVLTHLAYETNFQEFFHFILYEISLKIIRILYYLCRFNRRSAHVINIDINIPILLNVSQLIL